MVSELKIRAERPADTDSVDALNREAFETDGEARLVDRLRGEAEPCCSLVAERAGIVVGHILFTPVTVDGHGDRRIAGLAPMAVRPEAQREGIGSALVRAGLAACREAGFGAVVVLGHPAYYPRFGFRPAHAWNLVCEFPAPAGAFMALELEPDYLKRVAGTVRYHPAFHAL